MKLGQKVAPLQLIRSQLDPKFLQSKLHEEKYIGQTQKVQDCNCSLSMGLLHEVRIFKGIF